MRLHAYMLNAGLASFTALREDNHLSQAQLSLRRHSVWFQTKAIYTPIFCLQRPVDLAKADSQLFTGSQRAYNRVQRPFL